MVPIVAIVGGLATAIIKSLITSSERRMQMRMMTQQGVDEATRQQIEALKLEVAQLRDTTTQFALSLEQTVTRLDQRVGHIESGSTRTPNEAAAPYIPVSGR